MKTQRRMGGLLESVSIVGSLLFLFFASCSNRSQLPPTQPSLTQENSSQNEEKDPLNDYSSDTANDDDKNDDAKKDDFATTTSQDSLPKTTRAPARTSQEEACLVDDRRYYDDEEEGDYRGVHVSTRKNACVDNSRTRRAPSELLLSTALGSFQLMSECFETEASWGTRILDSQVADVDVSAVFRTSRLALVRCYRRILGKIIETVPFVPEQEEAVQSNDSNFFLLLSLLGSE